MVARDFYKTRSDGVSLYRSYSTDGVTIRQVETGIVYGEAIDVEDAGYTYVETDELVETEGV